MPEGDAEKRADNSASTSPAVVKKLLLWLGIATSILIAVSTIFDSTDKLIISVTQLFKHSVSQTIDTSNSHNTPLNPNKPGFFAECFDEAGHVKTPLPAGCPE